MEHGQWRYGQLACGKLENGIKVAVPEGSYGWIGQGTWYWAGKPGNPKFFVGMRFSAPWNGWEFKACNPRASTT